jgi:hypothetical protein
LLVNDGPVTFILDSNVGRGTKDEGREKKEEGRGKKGERG